MTKLTERQLITIGSGQTDKAIAFAGMENETVSKAINEQMEAKEITESGAIRILLAMQSAYGEKLSEFPRPGSTPEETNNPDVIKVEKTNANGNKTAVKSSFYVAFADATTEGKAILQELGWIKLLRNPEADHNLVGKEFREAYKNPQDYRIREGYLTGRRNTIRMAYKKAMALVWQMNDIQELDKVNIDFVWEDYKTKTKVRNTKTPIRLSSTENPDDWDYLSISTVMRVDVAKAQENGGTFQAVKDTLKRDKTTDNATDGNQAKPQMVRTADTFAARINDISEALNYAFTESNGKKLHAEMQKALTGAGSEDYISNLLRVRNHVDELLKAADAHTQVRIEKIEQALKAA